MSVNMIFEGRTKQNLLTSNQQNMSNWTKNGSFTITNTNGVNNISLSTGSSSEYIHLYDVSTIEGESYKFVFEGCTPSGFEYASGQSAQQFEIYSPKQEAVIASEYWNGEASETYRTYSITFTADNNKTHILFPFGKLKDYTNYTMRIRNLALYKI